MLRTNYYVARQGRVSAQGDTQESDRRRPMGKHPENSLSLMGVRGSSRSPLRFVRNSRKCARMHR